MISDILVSLKDNIQKRSKNQILGSFTIVYIVKNWELFYSVLFFDSSLKLEDRLQYIRNYYLYHNFWENFFQCIGIAVVIMLLTYVALALGRFVSSFYNSKIEKWIFKVTDNKKIVLKSEYDELLEMKSKFETKYENERKEKTNIIEERDKQYNKYLEMIATKNENEIINNLSAQVESLIGQLSAKDSEVESFKKLIENKDDTIKSLNARLERLGSKYNDKSDPKLAKMIYSQMEANELLPIMERLIQYNSSGEFLDTMEYANKLIFFIDNNLVLFERGKVINPDFVLVNFTALGEQVRDIYLMEKSRINKIDDFP